MFTRSLRTIAQQRRVIAKKFHAGKPASNAREGADECTSTVKTFHYSSTLLIASPIVFLLPQNYVMPFDLLFGLLIPLHSHIALNYVITDYVPKKLRSGARFGVLAVTLLAAGGIFKLNWSGPGVTASIKAMWADKKAIAEK